MNRSIVTPKFLRIAFLCHALYFVFWGLIFDFFPAGFGGLFGLEAPSNVIGIVGTDVASGGLLTVAVLYFLASRQAHLPRLVLAAAIFQAVYNLYHDAVWFWNGFEFSLVLLDAAFIATMLICYLLAWKNAQPAIRA